jgi:hypothetical protein
MELYLMSVMDVDEAVVEQIDEGSMAVRGTGRAIRATAGGPRPS